MYLYADQHDKHYVPQYCNMYLYANQHDKHYVPQYCNNMYLYADQHDKHYVPQYCNMYLYADQHDKHYVPQYCNMYLYADQHDKHYVPQYCNMYLYADQHDKHYVPQYCNRVIPCQINQFFAKCARPPPISMKFGTLADNAGKKICANFQRCRSSGFRDMTFQKMEKGSIFATRPVSQMSITFFLLEVGSSMIALFKALIWLYNSYLSNYNKSPKPKSDIFWKTLTSNKKKRPFSKKIIGSFIRLHLLHLSIKSHEWDHQYWIL